MSTTKQQGGFIDLKAMIRILKDHWYWFLISVVVCCGLAFAYVKIHKPVYLYSANMLIAKESGDISSRIPDMGMISGMLGVKNSVEDELLILKSRSLTSQVVKDLELNRQHYERYGLFNMLKRFKFNDYAIDVQPANVEILDTLGKAMKFHVELGANGKADISVKAGKRDVGEYEGKTLPFNVATPYGDFVVSTTKEYQKGEALTYDVTVSSYGGRAEALQKVLEIATVTKKTNIVRISIKSAYPEFATELINNMMEAYNERGIADKRVKDDRTLKFMNSRIELMTADLTGLETRMQDYMEREGITLPEADVKYILELKGKLEASLVETETQAQVMKMLRDFLSDPSNKYSMLPATEATPAEVVNAYNELIVKRMQLEQNARGDNKVLATVNDQIESMRKSILEAVDKAYEAASIGLAEARSLKSGTDSRISRLPEQQREVLGMMRDQLVKEKILAFLVQQREQAAMSVANAIPKGTVIDYAYSGSKPQGIGGKILLIIAFLFGLMIPVVWIYLRMLIRGKFVTKSDLQRHTDLLVVGEACHTNETHIPAISEAVPTNGETEQFRTLRSDVLFRLDGGKVILVTSTSRGDGTTYVAMNLASSLALTGKRTVLVEMNLRNPSLAKLLEVSATPGLVEAVKGNGQLNVQNVGSEENLDVIVAGKSTPHPSELLACDAAQQLIDDLKNSYDYVVIDSAPVDEYSDTMSLGRLADVTLYVMRSEHTPVASVQVASDLEESGRLPGLMLVANDTPFQSAGE